jgi:hypothetical protein
MGQVIQVNGDYNIKSKQGARITLDTGPGVGEVKVTGNLLVEGDTVYVSATNLDVEDNIIVLNKGETGAGVTLTYSGIQIDRGTLDPVSLIWNEDITIPTGSSSVNAGGWQIVGGPAGTYNFSDSRLKVKEIVTDPLIDNGDLLLIGSGTGVVKVIGTVDYEDQVTQDDDIPNKKYVDDSIQNNPTFQITTNDSRVIVTDKDTVGSTTYFFNTTGYSTFGESAVSILSDGVLTSQFYPDRVTVFDLQFEGTEISTKVGVTNENIKFSAQGSGKVQFNTALQLEQLGGSPPSFISNSTIIYAADVALGDSGVWFVNDNAQINKRNGELISKNKALLFSMIF